MQTHFWVFGQTKLEIDLPNYSGVKTFYPLAGLSARLADMRECKLMHIVAPQIWTLYKCMIVEKKFF